MPFSFGENGFSTLSPPQSSKERSLGTPALSVYTITRNRSKWPDVHGFHPMKTMKHSYSRQRVTAGMSGDVRSRGSFFSSTLSSRPKAL
jgi:hypothetical protein